MAKSTKPRAPSAAQQRKRIDRVFAAQMAHRHAVSATGAPERVAKLKRLKASILRNRSRIYAALKEDFRKPESETDLSEIYVVTGEIDHAVRHLKQWMRPVPVSPTLAFLSTRGSIHYEPKGVVLIISPWNFPFNLALGPLVSAIAAGNCAMLKPSELTPATSALIREMLGELFDENEVAVFEGGIPISTALLKKPFHHMFFTGSPAVGKVVMHAAADHLATVTLELGGKSPAIVDESANLADSSAKLTWGKFMNNGQTCIAPDYVLVHESQHDALVAGLKAAVEKSYGKTPEARKKTPDYARIVSKKHHSRLKQLIDDALRKGARLAVGGASDASDHYIEPTVLAEVPDHATVMKEEIFGPVLPVLRYRHLDDVISRINAGEKPLALYMFSRNRKNTEEVLSRTSAGTTCVNDAVVHFLHPNLPFGGINNSGAGNSHGLFGFKAFSHERPVLRHHSLAALKLLYPPYTNGVKRLVRFVTRFV